MRISGIDSAIDLDEGRKTPRIDESAQFRDLPHGRFEQGLPAETGIDGHDQDVVAGIEQILEPAQGGLGVE